MSNKQALRIPVGFALC